MDEYRRLATIGRSFQIDARIVDPAEAHAIFPLLNPEVIVGGLYNPMDGCIDPTSFVNALIRSAKKNGGKVRGMSRVIFITVLGGTHTCYNITIF